VMQGEIRSCSPLETVLLSLLISRRNCDRRCFRRQECGGAPENCEQRKQWLCQGGSNVMIKCDIIMALLLDFCCTCNVQSKGIYVSMQSSACSRSKLVPDHQSAFARPVEDHDIQVIETIL
jgi:hypothetical protein